MTHDEARAEAVEIAHDKICTCKDGAISPACPSYEAIAAALLAAGKRAVEQFKAEQLKALEESGLCSCDYSDGYKTGRRKALEEARDMECFMCRTNVPMESQDDHRGNQTCHAWKIRALLVKEEE